MFRASELPERLNAGTYVLPVTVETEHGVRTRPVHGCAVGGPNSPCGNGTVLLLDADLAIVAELSPEAWVRFVDTVDTDSEHDGPRYVYDGARGDWYDVTMPSIVRSDIPANWPVQPADDGDATCGYCQLSWHDAVPTSMTPAPAGRCPFEEFHRY